MAEAVELCRRSHQLAPFCHYNGNTFAAVIRDVIHQLKISEPERVVLRSLAGHIVAGVAQLRRMAAAVRRTGRKQSTRR